MIDATQLAFENALRKNPLDEVTRGVYADYLDENGEHIYADRQRKWVKSFLFLLPFYDYYEYGVIYDDKGRSLTEIELIAKMMPELVAKITNYWIKFLNNEPYFESNWARDTLRNEKVKMQFWECFCTITSHIPDQEIVEQEWYRCGC